MERIFTRTYDKWSSAVNKSAHVDYSEPEVTEVADGIILPLKKDKELSEKTLDGFFLGGVCTAQYEPVAGHIRNRKVRVSNYNCWGSYRPDEILDKSGETVIFGGVLHRHFGHCMVEYLSRLWWYVEHPEVDYRVIFVRIPGHIMDIPKEYIRILGIPEDRYEILEKPTRFGKVIVADETIHFLECTANYKWLSVIDRLGERADTMATMDFPEKIYLTRTAFDKDHGAGEQFYEDYFTSVGYTVISPEQLSIADQMHMFRHAKEVACTLGTLSHGVVFSAEGTRITMLLRCDELVLIQMCINKIRNLDWYFVEANMNFMPTSQGESVTLYAPTPYFRQYLETTGMPYTEEMLDQEKYLRENLYDYLKIWAKTYKRKTPYKRIYGSNIRDVIINTNRVFCQEELKKSDFPVNTKMKKKKNTSIKAAAKHVLRDVKWLFFLLYLKITGRKKGYVAYEDDED